MPSQRRLRIIGLLIALTFLAVIYLSNSGHSTRTSEFYSRTVAALDAKHRAAQEALDLENHKKIQAAAEAEAVAKAKDRDPDSPVPVVKEKGQKPFAVDVEEAAKKAQSVAASVADGAQDAVHGVTGAEAAEKSVAGRKMMKGLKDDGVAKVGNSGAKDPASGSKEGEDTSETDEEHAVEVELNAILKKSPSKWFSRAWSAWETISANITLQSSSSPRATVPIPKRQSISCLTTTTLYRRRTLKSSTSTLWASNCKLLWKRLQGDERCPTS